uniref:Major facilitator superfamily (MFS) profile domain-containing protein n=1 Tax=Leersia perrieri TaxID=77586 RepID=A0A0D9WBJ7_9ORYZ
MENNSSSGPLLLAVAAPDDEEKPLSGVSDFRGRPVHRATSGAWRSALFISGLEIAGNFAYFGVSANLITYLTGPLGHSNASAAAAVNAWSGAACMLPLLGAFLADSFLGRFRSILLACTLYVLGYGTLTVASSLPACGGADKGCRPPVAQVAFFYVSLYLIALAQGFDKPCGLAFAAEQFDADHPKERASRSSLFNWWYFCLATGISVSIAVVSYVQENVGWGVGFAIPFAVILSALVLFLLGTPTYRLRSHHKHHPSSSTWPSDVARLLPIWAACLAYGVAYAQITTLFNKQGRALDRHISGDSSLELPPAALQTLGPVTILVFVPVYDRLVVPALRRVTGNARGLTTLQRTGAGMALSLAAVAIAAAVEGRRLENVRERRAAMTWPWIVPQYVAMGVADVLAVVGMQEFFHGEMPDGMRSLGLALYFTVMGIGGFISSALVSLLDAVTRRDGSEGWFADDLDRGHLDYFYCLLAAISAAELALFLCFARSYVYTNSNNTLLHIHVPTTTTNTTTCSTIDHHA